MTYSFFDSASCASSDAIFKLSEFSFFVVASIVSFNFFSEATFSFINVNDVSLVTFAFGAEITVTLFAAVLKSMRDLRTVPGSHNRQIIKIDMDLGQARVPCLSWTWSENF